MTFTNAVSTFSDILMQPKKPNQSLETLFLGLVTALYERK